MVLRKVEQFVQQGGGDDDFRPRTLDGGNLASVGRHAQDMEEVVGRTPGDAGGFGRSAEARFVREGRNRHGEVSRTADSGAAMNSHRPRGKIIAVSQKLMWSRDQSVSFAAATGDGGGDR